MACMPSSGWNAWRYHMAEKSPTVQPTRHRRVLTPARFHVALELQKSRLSVEGVGALADLQVEVVAVLLQVEVAAVLLQEDDAGAVLLLHFGRDWHDRIAAAGFLERLKDMGERGCEAERTCRARVDREVRKSDEALSATNGSITANFLISLHLSMATPKEIEYLRQAVALAREALEAGDDPFGSVLVDPTTGHVLQAHRNRTVTGAQENDAHPSEAGKPDPTLHPEFTLARWAQFNLSAEQRSRAVVYTSGEHCAMCAAAHAYCGLGRIVYATSTEQYGEWRRENGVAGGKVAPLSIRSVAPGVAVGGPVLELADEVRALHVQRWAAKRK
ncbi:unnamed protein product [Clonostachys solani]|uniref:CMP/dCMP-type deaminase domain-containing protein n=1 Tax=Clonostachys solani TaxID=160281 RepID=A0A9N9ZJG6_9HYPO|nr:unnamed protein product [Clonostachys solani]